MRTTLLALLVLVRIASAGRTHVVERGETLEHVARVYGCSTAAVLRANHVDTTLVPAGTVVRIPDCRRVAVAPPPPPPPPIDDDDRARRALAAIDGTVLVGPTSPKPDASVGRSIDAPLAPRVAEPQVSHSVGDPWRGKLSGGVALPRGEGYAIRRPQAAFGAEHVVAQLRRVIAEVRALHPQVHTLAIGDLSAEHGGQLSRHLSHQTGLDVDVGLYFTRVPADYPTQFVPANADLDLEATWALLLSFARTTGAPGGVQIIFLDRAIQARLYRWAHARGTPDAQLAALLEVAGGGAALVRHWPSHTDHMHVRFRPAAP